METDIVIYNKETKEIFAIITNANLTDNTVVIPKRFEAKTLKSDKEYIITQEDGKILFSEQNAKIFDIEDYR